MRELSLERLSEDGRFLIVRDAASGDQFHLRADHRLTSLIDASSRNSATTGQLEMKMEINLSPREIQTRIRRGESSTSVAASAGVSVESIDRFAGPVLAEREYTCEQARKSAVRRQHAGGNVALGELVDQQIAASGGVPDAAVWDSWRREDGRWTVVVTPNDDTASSATFTFDAKGRFTVPADECAYDLIGDVALTDSGDMAIADAVRTEADTSPAAPAPEGSSREEHDDEADDLAAPISSLTAAREKRAMEQLAIEIEAEAADSAEHVAPVENDDFEDAIEHDVAVPDTGGARKKRHERRRVPSWDEIMFGGKED